MLDSLIVHATLVVLILLSVGTWSIAVLKFRQNKLHAQQTQAFESAFLNAQDWNQGQALAQQSAGDLAQIISTGFKAYSEVASPKPTLGSMLDPLEALSRPMRQNLQEIMRKQERGLAELATIGSTSPFIGLFGTVWGIMDALQVIGATGQASIDVVAGPIGEALIATAVGILAAIPAVLLYNYFLRQQKLRLTKIEGFIEMFIRMAARQQAQQGRVV